jgi:trans-AT polyketide synthase/acyltransferase/oxidoreductase domain-containing protein
MKQAILFPGQGSQEVGMGRALFDKYSEYVDTLNDIFGKDIRSICLNGPETLLNHTPNAQAAIFLCNTLYYIEWCENNLKPDFVLGHSIGQYNAMFAAGMITYEDAAYLVKHRGNLMAQQKGGAMAAVMKISAKDLMDVLNNHPIGEFIDIANFNSQYQTVIAFSEDKINEVIEYLESLDAFVVRLRTTGAFHSRHMRGVLSDFKKTVDSVDFSSPKINLICNLSADYITKPEVTLIDHLVQPVKWYQSIYKVLSIDKTTQFYESGWGKTLTNLLRYNRKEMHNHLL